jgi:hypothetical protein
LGGKRYRVLDIWIDMKMMRGNQTQEDSEAEQAERQKTNELTNWENSMSVDPQPMMGMVGIPRV